MKKALLAVLLLAALAFSYALGRRHARPESGAVTARRVLYYVDPMHPAYKSDKPGIAPDCGMKLEPVYADDTESRAGDALPDMPPGSVRIDFDKQQLIGVRVVPVEQTSGARTVRLLGRVAAEDNRIYRVNAAVEGWVQETYDDATGAEVKKDQRLAAFYSPEFVTFENGYLAAAERGTTPMKEFARDGINYSADRLRALGMSDMQIMEIGATKKMPKSIFVVSPTDGIVLERNISVGQRFERHADFYRIADLSRVWIVAEIFENEATYFRPGAVARVSLPGRHKTFVARVTNVLPQVDSSTRTLKLRLEADNPGSALRPDMFVDVELPVPAPSGLTVPTDALVDFGLKQRVFVERGNGLFEPREIETGWRLGDRVQIVKGLSAGDRVVAAGTFLLDSESRLRTAATGASGAPVPAERHDDSMPPPSPQLKPAMAMQSSPTHDPKCGMKIDPAKASTSGNTLDYRGTTYYFCSKQCKSEFEKDPDRYLTSRHDGGSHGGAGHD